MKTDCMWRLRVSDASDYLAYDASDAGAEESEEEEEDEEACVSSTESERYSDPVIGAFPSSHDDVRSLKAASGHHARLVLESLLFAPCEADTSEGDLTR